MCDDGWTSTAFSSRGWVRVFCPAGMVVSQWHIPDHEPAVPRAGVWEDETIGMQTLVLHLGSQD
jgi:hypothetical protein